MGGSGGGGFYTGVSSADLKEQLKHSAEQSGQEFRPSLQALLDEQLAAANKRDTELVNERRELVKEALQDELDLAVDLPFGGSVAKHTYVDGISDIDTLLVLKDYNAEQISPSEVKDAVSTMLDERLPDCKVTGGRIAITIEFPNGPDLQLVPSVRDGEGYKVPAWTRNQWSSINPADFAAALTRRNDQCSGKLVPTIKLAKAINANLPEPHQLSGYHIESLAIDSFRNYRGTCTTSEMLPHFFHHIGEKVLSPIRDSSGQSIHVDEYLGRANSEQRKRVGHVFQGLSKRMKNASSAGSESQWRELFRDD